MTTDAAGSTALNGGSVTTTGAQSYGDAATLGADTTLTSTGSGNVSFGTTVDGAFNLTINTAGVTAFNGAVGSTTPLTSVTTDAPGSTDINGGSIATTGAQTFGDAVSLSADATLTSTGSGNVSFGSTVDGGFNLTVNTAGVTAFNGAVGSMTPLTSVTTDAPGSTDINGGSVTTTGAQSYGDAVTLSSDTTLTSTGSGNVSFSSTVDGGFNLAVNTAGVTTFGGAVGSTTPLTSVTTDAPGSTDLNGGSVTTTGAQTYNDAVTLSSDDTLTSTGSGNITFGSTIDGGFTLTVSTGGSIAFGGAIGSTTPLTSLITNGGCSLTFSGGVTTTGSQSYTSAIGLTGDSTFTSTGNGNITFGSTIDGGFNLTVNTGGMTSFDGPVGSTTPLTSVTTDAPGSTDINGGSVTTTGDQTYDDAMILTADDTLTSSGSGNVTFGSTVDGGFALTVDTAGVTTFNGAVGSTTPLTAITTDAPGSTNINGGSVTTTGAQSFGDGVTLAADTTLTSTGSGNVNFGSTVDGGFNLTVNTAGVTTFGGAVGSTTPLTSVTTDAPGSTDIDGGSVTTTGVQAYGDAVTLGADTTLDSTGSGNITFGSTVDGAFNLTVNTAGVTTFGGAVGSTTPLTSLTTDAPGSTDINGGSVTTTGAQAYGDAVTLGADTTLTSTGSGNVSLGSTVDGGFNFTVNTAGVTTFGGAVGSTTPLTSVTTDAPGSTDINGGSVTTTGAQSFGDAVTLEANTTLVSTGSGNVSLGSTVDGGFNLTVNTAGGTTFGGAVGSTTPLTSVTTDAPGSTTLNGGSVTTTGAQSFGDAVTLGANTTLASTGSGDVTLGATVNGAFTLTVNTAGVTTFGGAVGSTTPLTSVTTDAPGSTDISAGSITTTGTQTYGDAVVLGANTTLTSTGSGNVTLGATVNGGSALTVNTAGTTIFSGVVGGATPLTSVTTDAPGSTDLNGGSVTTTGAQSYGNAVTLGATTTLVSTGSGNITLGSTVNGLFGLTVNTGGVRTFTGVVGGTTPLASLTTSAAGSTSIQGGTVTTTGAQTFGDPVTLLADTALISTSSGNVTLGSTVNGAFSLTVNTAGVTNFAGAVGGTTPLASVTTDAPGSTTLSGGTVSTTGAQTYGDPVTLGANATLTSTNSGNVSFAKSVDGAYGLTVNTGGDTTFIGNVGLTTPLASLTTDAAGTSQINCAAVVTTGNQTFNDPASVNSDIKFTTTAGGSITFGGTLAGNTSIVEFNTGNSGDLTFEGLVGSASNPGTFSGFTIEDALDVVIGAGIYVDGPVLVSSAQNVTVTAGGSVGSLTQTTGTGTTTLSGSSLAATGPVNITNTAINLQGGLDASGEPVVLDATSGGVTQGTSVAPLIASDLSLTGAGTFKLNNAANQLPSFNANVNGPVTLQVVGAFTLDPKGVTTSGNDVNLFIGTDFTVNDNGSSQTAPMINAGTTGNVLIVPGLQATTSLTTFNANIAAKSVQFGNDGTGLPSGSPYTGTAYQNTGDDTFQIRPSPSTTITVVGGLPNTIPGDSILPITTDPAITNVQFVPTPPDAAGGSSISGYYLITYTNTTQTKIIFRGIESFENSGLQAAVVQTGPTTYSVRIQQVQGTTVLSNGVTGQGLPSTVTINITSIQNPPTVTFGDVNGDGIPDMIIASGAGSSPLITVVNGVYLTAGSPLGSTPVNLSNLPAAAILGQFSPFSATFGGGLSVAAGDFAGTGKDEVAVAPGPGGGPVVEFWSLASGTPQMTSSFFALDTSFRGGLHLASGTFDGKVDLVVGAGVGGGPRVEVFSGGNGALIDNFFAYNSAYRGGVLVAAGNFDGNGEEIATAAGPGGGPNVKVFEGGNNTVLVSIYAFTAASLGNFFQTGVGSLAFGAPIAATTADILANALPQQQELLVSTSPGPQLQILRLIDSAGTVVPAPGADLYTSLTSPSGSAILNPTTGQPLQESDLTDGATVAGM